MTTALTDLPRALAGVLADTARDTGHRIDTNTAVSGLEWQADVLATSPSRRPTILQVAPPAADSEEIRAQTAQALQHGLDIVWFTPKPTTRSGCPVYPRSASPHPRARAKSGPRGPPCSG